MNVRAHSDRIGAISGIVSLALLAASLKWAHHWTVRADLLLSCWVATAVGALWFSIRALRARDVDFELAPALVQLGIWSAAVSLAALALTGLAAAAGRGPAGGCGGG